MNTPSTITGNCSPRYKRCLDAICGRPSDRAPTYMPAIACSVASLILGRPAYTGTHSLHYAEVLGRWADGRLGVVRGNRAGNNGFGGTIHRKTRSFAFDVSAGKKPFYASLLDQVIPFFHGKTEVVSPAEMVEVIAFLDAANRSAETRHWIPLSH